MAAIELIKSRIQENEERLKELPGSGNKRHRERIYKRLATLKTELKEAESKGDAVDEVAASVDAKADDGSSEGVEGEESEEGSDGEEGEEGEGDATNSKKRKRTKTPKASMSEEERKELQRKRQARVRGLDANYEAKQKSLKVKNAERREVQMKSKKDRLKEHDPTLECFLCRDFGHTVRNCPKAKDANKGDAKLAGICFNCGEKGHSIHKCPKPKVEGVFQFAVCYICQGTGHLARECKKNEKGLYPHGGGCHRCGENTHLAKDCKLLPNGQSCSGCGSFEHLFRRCPMKMSKEKRAGPTKIDLSSSATKKVVFE